MLSIILILLFMLSVLSVPVCQGVISGLYLFGMKVFPGLFISFIITNILVRLIEYKKINNPLILVAAGLMTGFPVFYRFQCRVSEPFQLYLKCF